MSIVKLALYGIPGAGKSTSSGLVESYCQDNEIWFQKVKLAEPLYRVQAYIYEMTGHALRGHYQQDGRLLNFLGTYMRELNPSVLLEHFDRSVSDALARFDAEKRSDGIILCDDLRYIDSEFVRSLGFQIVQISATVEECARRRTNRGDLSLGSLHDPIERDTHKIVPDHIIENLSSVASLRRDLRQLVDGLLQ